MTDPGRYFRNNVAGSLSLLQAMVAAGVGRFVFSSSCSVYGCPERSPTDESTAIRPISPYAESRAMVERMLTWYGAVHGLRSIALRYFNAAGAHPAGDLGEDWDTSTMLPPAVLKAAAGRRPPRGHQRHRPATPDSAAIRDYIHVVDLADAHVRALRALDAGEPVAVWADPPLHGRRWDGGAPRPRMDGPDGLGAVRRPPLTGRRRCVLSRRRSGVARGPDAPSPRPGPRSAPGARAGGSRWSWPGAR